MGFCLVALEMRHTCTQHGPDNLHARQAAGAEDAQEGVVRAAVLLQILPVPLGGIVDGHYVVCRRGKMRAQRLGVQCRAAQAGPRRGAGGAWGGVRARRPARMPAHVPARGAGARPTMPEPW